MLVHVGFCTHTQMESLIKVVKMTQVTLVCLVPVLRLTCYYFCHVVVIHAYMKKKITKQEAATKNNEPETKDKLFSSLHLCLW